MASAYERFRPGYPAEIATEISGYAGRPIGTVLEIGAGTGKATRLFADRGLVVTATDPDPAMLAELRKHVPTTVTTTQASFEELPLVPRFDLVFAAASLHWTKPEQRWERVAAMLTPQGIFASVGGPVFLADPELGAAVADARSAFIADDDVPSPDGTPPGNPLQWPGTELTRSALFTDIRQTIVKRRLAMPASDYIGYLSTVSAYLELPDHVRNDILVRILDVLPPRVDVVADITVHLARLA